MARSFNEALTHARRAAAPRRVAAALALSITWGLGAPAAARAQGGAPNLQHTKNTPDLGLRSELKVDPSTLGMSVRIPLGSYPGRVGADLSFALQYNSKVWRVEFEDFVNGGLSGCSNSPEAEVGTECYTTTRALYGENSVAGWTFIGALPTIEAGGERYDASGRACCDGDPARGFYIPRLTVRFPDGSSHELRRGDAPLAGADPQTGTYYSVDSSRMKYVGASPGAGTLYMPDGSRYEFAGGAATRYVDSNGNVLTAQADTLGRQITAPSFHNGFAHTETRTLPGVGGAPMSYTFDLRELGSPGVLEPDMLTGQTPALRRLGDRQKFGNEVYDNALFSSVEGTRLLDPFTFNPVVLHRLTLPDGSAYTFTYNEYGEIAKVAYPAGGHERYRYGPVPSLTRLDAPYTQANRGVLERRVSAGGAGEGEAVWLYEGGGASVTSVAPDGTRTVRLNHTGYPFGSVLYGLDDPRAGMEYERRVYAPQSQGGAMLRRTLTEWGVAGPLPGGHPSAKRDPKVLRTVELLLDTGAGAPLARSTTYQYAQASQPLNVTAVTEHAFVEVARATAEGGPVGDIPAGAPLRTTETAYKDEPAYNERNMVALPVSVAVRAGGPGNGPSPGAVVARTEVYYDEASYAGADMSPLPCGATEGREATVPAARGNVTTTGRWLDTLGATDNPSAYLDAHARYDGCGSVRRTWEPAARGGLSARFAETEYSPDYQSAYPTRSLSAVPDPTGARGSNVPLETASVYDAATGLVLSVTDVNNQTTTGYSYHDPDTHAPDPLSRLRRVSLPDGGSTRYDYGAAPDNFYVRARTAIDASRSTDFYQFFDGLGRPSRAYSFDGGAPGRTWVAVKTQRDERTRTVKVSHPHFRTDLDDFDLDAAQGGVPFTTTASDPLGRVTSVLSPGGAAALTEYVGAEVTAADEAGVKRSSVTDALGRLERVVEAPGVEGYGYETTYEHDALGNLRKVTQGRAGQTRQTRLFAYDSLARLTSSVSPEGGASSFAYDAAGDLTRRTDARHVRADYSYDALHRPVGR
ncbi:MAG TPA: RHS repeat domain-containing protein, partial [Pyrinomonadaceae bacterium]